MKLRSTFEPGIKPEVFVHCEFVKQNIVLGTNPQRFSDCIHVLSDIKIVDFCHTSWRWEKSSENWAVRKIDFTWKLCSCILDKKLTWLWFFQLHCVPKMKWFDLQKSSNSSLQLPLCHLDKLCANVEQRHLKVGGVVPFQYFWWIFDPKLLVPHQNQMAECQIHKKHQTSRILWQRNT